MCEKLSQVSHCCKLSWFTQPAKWCVTCNGELVVTGFPLLTGNLLQLKSMSSICIILSNNQQPGVSCVCLSMWHMIKRFYMNFKSARPERCWAYFSCGFTNKTIDASWKILGLTTSQRKEMTHFSEKERMKYRKGKKQALHAPFAPFAPYASISSPPAPFSQTWFFHSCV